MGFLEIGAPLDWEDTKRVTQYIKQEGLKQLLHTWRVNRYREDHDLKWGDELEYMMVHMDCQTKKARLYIDAPNILKQLHKSESEDSWPTDLCRSASLILGHRIPYLHSVEWHPEFANFMIEAVPALPFDLSVNSLLHIEESMVSRRCKLQSVLPPNVYVISMPAFPRLGLPDSTIRSDETHGPQPRPGEVREASGRSQFYTAEMVNPHPRFETLVNNILMRRQCRPTILMPVYKDLYTHELSAWSKSLPIGDPRDPKFRAAVDQRAQFTVNPVREQIYMDHFGFGMGNHCLQMTFGAPSLPEARYLYDQMAVLAPLFLSLSAGTAALRGLVSDLDTRWLTLEQGCDCRSDEELVKLKNSRYGPVNLYISECEYFKRNRQVLNDEEVPIDATTFKYLTENGMDSDLARHFGSLWIRDPLVVFKDRLHLDPTKFADHFENIQSTNWNSVRFKPPPKALEPLVCTEGSPKNCRRSRLPKVGWRVELRTPDIQMSDFGNAALAGISCILAMAIYREHWRFYIPMSLLKENFKVAHQRNGLLEGLFYFRNDIDGVSCSSDTDCLCGPGECCCARLKQADSSTNGIDSSCAATSMESMPSVLPAASQDERAHDSLTGAAQPEEMKRVVCRMSMREIWLGSKRAAFPGLLTLLDKFVSQEWRNQRCSVEAVHMYRLYANYLRSKVLGQVKTDASVIRKLIQSHPTYENNSDVNETIAYDICRLGIASGFGLSHALRLEPSLPQLNEESRSALDTAVLLQPGATRATSIFSGCELPKSRPRTTVMPKVSDSVRQSPSSRPSSSSSLCSSTTSTSGRRQEGVANEEPRSTGSTQSRKCPSMQKSTPPDATDITQRLSRLFSVPCHDVPLYNEVPEECGFSRVCRCDSINAVNPKATEKEPGFDTELFLQVDQLSR